MERGRSPAENHRRQRCWTCDHSQILAELGPVRSSKKQQQKSDLLHQNKRRGAQLKYEVASCLKRMINGQMETSRVNWVLQLKQGFVVVVFSPAVVLDKNTCVTTGASQQHHSRFCSVQLKESSCCSLERLSHQNEPLQQ